MGAIENVLDNTRFMHMICSIAHLLRMFRVRQHSLQPGYDREVVKIFVGLPIGLASQFLAVGAFSEVLIWSNEANAAVYTTAVTYRLKSSKRSNMLLGNF